MDFKFTLPERKPESKAFWSDTDPRTPKKTEIVVNHDTGESSVSIEHKNGEKEIRGTINGKLKRGA